MRTLGFTAFMTLLGVAASSCGSQSHTEEGDARTIEMREGAGGAGGAGGMSGLLEIAPPQEEVAPPQDEVAPPQEETAPPQEAAPPQDEVAPPQAEADEPQEEAAATEAPVALPGSTEGCPDGMVRVEGEYCPAVVQECLEYHPEWTKRHGEPGVAARCLRFREPSRCVAKKTESLSFCMDRYEYPNVPGEVPHTLTSWEQAANLCAAQGKRLCTEAEFNFACEGPEMLPYVYGYERDAETCNQDREYRFPDHSQRLLHHAACQQNERCAAELARLDGREPAGSRAECASWAGVFDLNGNVNEWVVRTDQKAPYRSGLKGGWWGPIRSQCRPMTTFHKEDDYGYEVGFRCCADAEAPAAE
ncbi:SUMF1/EgtB/PvdO family nonheme iron enzyme [Sorangium sp. So ce315]|uniref:SUMF1/EgtB/PvdO family nonheme iron enzyme n=1 Tax=Sorangium sp. So ce315 TaxID=3133299 RepID=UPI003F608506